MIIGQAMALVIGLSRSAMTAEFERTHMEKELRSGIHRREFVLHYQPIVSLSTGEIVGVEALVRWQHPVWGLGLPAASLRRPRPQGSSSASVSKCSTWPADNCWRGGLALYGIVGPSSLLSTFRQGSLSTQASWRMWTIRSERWESSRRGCFSR